MGQLSILNDKGHTPVVWDVTDRASVDEAIKVFETELAKGRTAYRVDGQERTITREFPVEAEQVVIVAPLVGG